MRGKIRIVMIWAAVLIAATAISFGAEPTLEIQAPETLPAAGETFDIDVTLTGNPGVNLLEFQLVYDPAVLECTEVVEGSVLKQMLSSTNEAYSQDSAIVAAAALNAAEEDGVVVTLRFRVLKEPQADVAFSLREADLADEEGMSLSFTAKDALIHIHGEAPKTDEPEAAEPSPDKTETPDKTPAKPIIEDVIEEVLEPAIEDAVEEAANPKTTFTDTQGHWAESYIARAVQRGLFKGYDEDRFGPDDPVTRGQFVTVLYRQAGSPAVTAQAPFTDMAGELAEFQKAVSWGYEAGFVNGKSDTQFDPKASLTRQEAMKLLYGYAGGLRGLETMFTAAYDDHYADSGDIAAWAREAVYWGVYHELITGTGDATLEPQGTATRAQLAKILLTYTEQFGRTNGEGSE